MADSKRASTGSTGTVAPSQSSDDDFPLDDEAKALKLAEKKAASRKALAESEKAIAEAEKATLAARLPSTEAVKPLEGKVEVGEKTGLVADLLAHSLVGDAATAIVESITGLPTDATVLVTDDRALAKIDWPYEAISGHVIQQAEALTEALALFEPAQQKRDEAGRKAEEAVKEKARADAKFVPGLGLTLGAKVISAAPAAVNALASVIGMFRSDYAITNREVTIGTTPLIAAVAGRLTEDANVVAGGFGLVEGSEVAGKFWTAWSNRSELERRKVRVSSERIAPADKALAAQQQQLKTAVAALEKVMADADSSAEVIKGFADRVENLGREIVKLERSVAEDRADVAVADAVLARFDDFAKAVTNTPEGAAYPPLVAAAIQERLRAADGTEITHVLYVGLESAGGETIARRNLFLFPRLTYIGGVQVSHLLLDVAKKVLTSAGTQSLAGQVKYELFRAELAERTGPSWLGKKLPGKKERAVAASRAGGRDSDARGDGRNAARTPRREEEAPETPTGVG